MNYNSNQDNYLLNQNTQQRYLNIQSFETQSEQTLKIIDFSYSNEFQDLSGRFDFIKKMYIFLTVEFFINYVFLMLGIYTDMINWLYHLFLVCKFENGIEMCEIEFWPTWLFYFSLSISIVLQFILYFGVVFLRQVRTLYINIFTLGSQYQMVINSIINFFWIHICSSIHFCGFLSGTIICYDINRNYVFNNNILNDLLKFKLIKHKGFTIQKLFNYNNLCDHNFGNHIIISQIIQYIFEYFMFSIWCVLFILFNDRDRVNNVQRNILIVTQ
ncbi:unnamed protein product [Paramecium sonneborni]|uniref:Transmembrane protein n=1 Tax=Paramecium sonneborni TaxID=65129 RepID=A0A8S1K616_9CILI|nr:unnamed protein product [Paramecium sonneborni]